MESAGNEIRSGKTSYSGERLPSQVNEFFEKSAFAECADYRMLNNLKEKMGTVRIMEGLDMSKPDSVDLLHIADSFARMGCDVVILHPVHFKSPEYAAIYGPLIGTKYERKCPDLMVDGKYYEYESYVRPWTKRKLSNMLTDGLRQSDKIILDNRDGTSFRQIIRSIRARLNINAQIKEVWVYDGDGVIDIYP